MALNASILSGWNLPFEMMLDFFRKKKIVISPNSWRDVMGEAHNTAFTVAQVTAADVLLDIMESLTEAMETGIPLSEWQANLEPILEEKGWLPETAEPGRKPLPGYRLKNIFTTNISSANNAGRWQQQQKLAGRRPYLQYMNPDDESTTEICGWLSGKVYRADDKIWKKLYPPNHFQCRSTVKSLREKDLKRRGLKVSKEKPPMGAEEGFDHDPETAWEPDLKKYPGPLKKQVTKTLDEGIYAVRSDFEARNNMLDNVRETSDLQAYESLFTAGQKDFERYIETVKKLSPEKIREEKERILRQMSGNLTPSEFDEMMSGLENLPFEHIAELRRAGVVIRNTGTKRPYYNHHLRAVHVGDKTSSSVYSHEIGHAIDDTILSKYGKNNRDMRFGKWGKTPYSPKNIGKKYKKWYDKNKTGQVNKYETGDGKYWAGNWVNDYEGRIYGKKTGPNFGEEFFADNTKRYLEYQRMISAGVSKKIALQGSQWEDAKQLYPEFTKFLEDFYGS